jgi:hypothetical protein
MYFVNLYRRYSRATLAAPAASTAFLSGDNRTFSVAFEFLAASDSYSNPSVYGEDAPTVQLALVVYEAGAAVPSSTADLVVASQSAWSAEGARAGAFAQMVASALVTLSEVSDSVASGSVSVSAGSATTAAHAHFTARGLNPRLNYTAAAALVVTSAVGEAVTSGPWIIDVVTPAADASTYASLPALYDTVATADCVALRLTLRYDAAPSQTSFALLRSVGPGVAAATVWSGNASSSAVAGGSESFTHSLCATGDYTIRVYDADGLCCSVGDGLAVLERLNASSSAYVEMMRATAFTYQSVYSFSVAVSASSPPPAPPRCPSRLPLLPA